MEITQKEIKEELSKIDNKEIKELLYRAISEYKSSLIMQPEIWKFKGDEMKTEVYNAHNIVKFLQQK